MQWTSLYHVRRRVCSRPVRYAIGAGITAAAAALLIRHLTQEEEGDQSLPREAVTFELDSSEDFYAFLFGFDAVCIAHGKVPSHVGKTLHDIHANDEIDSEELHERFVRTARAGGVSAPGVQLGPPYPHVLTRESCLP